MSELTPKQRVLKVWPRAYCFGNIMGRFVVWYDRKKGGGDGVIGFGVTAPTAWADAAKRLERKSK